MTQERWLTLWPGRGPSTKEMVNREMPGPPAHGTIRESAAVPNLTMSIPHQLTREEAKRRIQEGLDQARRQFSGVLGQVEGRWDRYTLDLTVVGAGQDITARALVEERTVEVAVALPWMLALLAGRVRREIERHARQLLQPSPPPE
jgi:hypothetical protein